LNYVDIIELLKIAQGVLRNVKVYGYISDKIERPANIFSNVKLEQDCSFRRFMCYAVDLSSYRDELMSLGLQSEKDMYLVNGEVCIYCKDTLDYPDWYCVDGHLRFGTKVSTDYVTMLNFVKNGDDWFISDNKPHDFSGSGVFNRELKAIAFGEELLPDEVKHLPPMRASYSIANIDNGESRQLPLERVNNKYQEKPNMVRVDRLEVAKRSRNYKILKDIAKKASITLDSSISRLNEKYDYDGECPQADELVVLLNNNLKRKASANCMTGRTLVTKYLSSFGKDSRFTYQGVIIKKFIIDQFGMTKDYILSGQAPMLEGKGMKFFKTAFSDKEEFYAGIVSAITNVDLKDAFETCRKHNLSLVKILVSNPYILFAVGVLTYTEADLLASVYGVTNDNKILRYKNMCMLHEYMVHSDTNSTVYNEVDLKSVSVKRKRVTRPIAETARVFLNSSVVQYEDEKRSDYLSRQYISLAIQDYKSYGLGVSFDGKVTATSLLNKELYVYDKLHKLASKRNDYKCRDIDKYIDEYEKQVGFKFEEQQRKAVHLIVNGAYCICGQAGGGKTTTVGCIVYVLERLNPSVDIKFGTPTGKAAKVLHGVVKRDVKTLYSLCKISPKYDVDYWNKTKNASGEGDYYILDEMSMVTLDLLHDVLHKVKDVNICFVGDINQLKSIGKGTILKNLLGYLPCVYLNVSKRSAECSGITYNSNVICNHSYSGDWQELKQTDDFKMIYCPNKDIPNVVKEVCNFYLGNSTENIHDLPVLEGIEPDDIEVASPFVKESYTWGTKQLNKMLQPIFNRATSHEGVCNINGTQFNIGDKVIHTSENTYSMQWYSSYECGKFQKVYGYGVANGDVGVFKGIISNDDAIFYDEVVSPPDDFLYYDMLRDDSTFDIVDGYFAVVEYRDVVNDRPYYILYRMMLKDNMLVGFDSNLLDLFYAGSVHKLQGSQYKVVVCCFGSVNYDSFLTRNMLYTLVTRGSDLVVLVGSEQQVHNARVTNDMDKVLTIGDILTEDV